MIERENEIKLSEFDKGFLTSGSLHTLWLLEPNITCQPQQISLHFYQKWVTKYVIFTSTGKFIQRFTVWFLNEGKLMFATAQSPQFCVWVWGERHSFALCIRIPLNQGYNKCLEKKNKAQIKITDNVLFNQQMQSDLIYQASKVKKTD